MKRFALKGVDALQKPVRLGKEVVSFINDTEYFSITKLSGSALKMVTPKGVYTLKKHTNQNYFHGVCKDRKVQVSLKATVGELRYW